MTARSKTLARNAAALGADLALTPAVIALRIPILAAEAGGALFDRRQESIGAVNEKWAALTEGIFAAQLAWLRGASLLPLALARAVPPAVAFSELAGAVAVAALQPAGRQVRRNLKRLSHR